LQEFLERENFVPCLSLGGRLVFSAVTKEWVAGIYRRDPQFLNFKYKIPTWFLNRQKDFKTGQNAQLLANQIPTALRDDLQRLKKIRAHRGLRHYWNLRVRGQHTKTTGRSGRTVGVSKKRGGD